MRTVLRKKFKCRGSAFSIVNNDEDYKVALATFETTGDEDKKYPEWIPTGDLDFFVKKQDFEFRQGKEYYIDIVEV